MPVGATTRALAGLAGWVVLAAAVAAVSTFAVNALGNELGDSGTQRPLSVAEVNARLIDSSSTAATPRPAASSNGGDSAAPSATASPTPGLPVTTSDVRVSTTVGGTLVYRCAADSVLVMSVTPAQGYSVADPPASVPTEHARVRFESATRRVDIDVRCDSGVAAVDVKTGNR